MAIKQLVADGNVNNPASWNGGTLPLSGDTCETNGFTGTIDADFECFEMNNNGGGKYIVTSDATITSNISVSSSTDVIEISSGVNAILIGDVNHDGSNTKTRCINMLASSTLTIVGDVTLTGTNWQNQHSVRLNGNCNCSIVGNVTNNTLGTGSGGQIRGVILLQGVGNTLIVTGDVISTSTTTNDKVITIYSDNNSVEVQGVVRSGQSSAILIQSGNNDNNQIDVFDVVAGNSSAIIDAIGPNGTSNVLTINGTITDNVSYNAILGFQKIITSTFDRWKFIDDTNNDKYLYSVSSGILGQAAESDVRKDVVYGPSSELTGELEPVVVDTAQLASDLLDEIQTSPHVVARRLRATSTDDSVGQIVASTLGNP